MKKKFGIRKIKLMKKLLLKKGVKMQRKKRKKMKKIIKNKRVKRKKRNDYDKYFLSYKKNILTLKANFKSFYLIINIG